MENSKEYISLNDADLKKILSYMSKFEMLIAEKDYSELEYVAECFICTLRNIVMSAKQESRREVLLRCADSMGITVQIKDSILEVTLPMILPTKSKTKTD